MNMVLSRHIPACDRAMWHACETRGYDPRMVAQKKPTKQPQTMRWRTVVVGKDYRGKPYEMG